MAPTFVTLFGTIWFPSNEELCNVKLTCKQARPSVTVKSQTKQLFIESCSGSRQSMLQLHQTWQTKFSIKWPFSGNKKLYTSKEVKEFPKMLQRSILSIQRPEEINSGMHRKHISLMTSPQSAKIICSVKTKDPPQHTPPVLLRFKF